MIDCVNSEFPYPQQDCRSSSFLRTYKRMRRETELELSDVFSIYGWSTYSPPELASLMIRASENHWFPLIRPAIKARFSRGGAVRRGVVVDKLSLVIVRFFRGKVVTKKRLKLVADKGRLEWFVQFGSEKPRCSNGFFFSSLVLKIYRFSPLRIWGRFPC